MIGIVVVSHSRALATAAVGLAMEMVAADDAPVVGVAAGLDETTFGTDATAVAEAIGAADSRDGVLVLLDLGSAVLSAEMALEFVDPDVASRVVVSSAPLVEGLVAAVVLASTGASIDDVAAEAARGLAAKQDHLGDVPADVSAGQAGPPAETADVLVANPHGLHARPAAKLVALVRSYDAAVTVADLDTGRGPVDAGSLSLVATLDARQGHRLRFGASGPQAADVLEAVRRLAGRSFDDQPAGKAATASGSGLDLAMGPAVVPDARVDLTAYRPGDADEERKRSDEARAEAVRELREVRLATVERVGDAEAGIFDAHLALLDDPAVLAGVETSIAAGAAAPDAWSQQLDQLAGSFEGLADAYQRERAQDVRSVRNRVLTILSGRSPAETLNAAAPDIPAGRSGAARPTDVPAAMSGEANGPGGVPAVLVVAELDAATAATLDAEAVAGVAVRTAGTTGHGVIVARSRGIPLITGIGEVAVADGTLVAFDARTGSFLVGPDPDAQAAFRATVAERVDERAAALRDAKLPVVTVDGQTVQVMANVGSVQDARAAVGADGSGLVRTEVLFGDRREAPSVDEQLASYLAIAAALGGRPITVRTWDVGGDKPLAFLPQAPEANPFLGERGLRVFRRRPELLRGQLTAICEAARQTPVRVMFPMVTTAEEVAWALAELDGLGPRPDGLQVGIMVEVPAAALRIASLARGLDFVSIGTNDLTQYATAADRGNGSVAALADGLDPAVLQLIDRVVRGVPAGVEVAVCGDLASDPTAAVLLAGLGIRELSAVGPQIPAVKARLRRTTLTEAAELANQALTLAGATEVRALLS
jgi:dihydroxyacetone kinase phosphotransfer subunit